MAAGASWCSAIGPPPSTTTPGWRSNGVLVSWAVPKGPTLDPDEKRLAMRTEDHPIEYFDFEGVIPHGEYGAGDVIIWDWGTFEPEETDDPAGAIRAGELKFRLFGERLRGRYTIVRTSGRGGRRDEREQWLLIKKRDEAAVEGWDAEDLPASVKTGRTNDEVKDGVPPRFEQPPPGPDVAPDLSQAREERQPDFVPPMMATLTDAAFDDDDWLYEVKWDGYRVEAVVSGGRARIWTRNRVDAATYFPNLAGPAPWIDAEEAIVDGEVVAFDEEGRPSFSRLQEKTGLRGTGDGHPPAPIRMRPTLTREEREAIPHGLHGLRPAAPRRAIAGGRAARGPQAPAAPRAAAATDWCATPRTSWARASTSRRRRRRRDWRGSWPSAGSARYQPGRRSRDWLKIKLRREQEMVVVGWLPGQGTHKDLGSLIVAVNDEGGLRHAGQVGQRHQRADAQGAAGRHGADPPAGPAADQEATAAGGALGRAAAS